MNDDGDDSRQACLRVTLRANAGGSRPVDRDDDEPGRVQAMREARLARAAGWPHAQRRGVRVTKGLVAAPVGR